MGHPSTADAQKCLHCQSDVPVGAEFARFFCCAGCETVFALLNEQGLDRYYLLAGDRVAPASIPATPRSHAWLEPLLDKALQSPSDVCALELDVQGVHCAACVWLFEELYRRRGGTRITVNAALGKVTLYWKRGGFDVVSYLEAVEAFGYQFGPSRKVSQPGSDGLTWRLGICVALTMNVMLFSASFYFGLGPTEPELFHLFGGLNLALSTVVVLVGGWPFFKSALSSLKSGVLHLDLPIALGIVLVYAMSLAQAAQGRGDEAYLDTLNVFITLMLTGRFLTSRVLTRNRNRLLEDDGAEGLLTRRHLGQQLEVVPAARIRRGDRLLIAPGDVVPVDATLDTAKAHISTDWVTGEAAPRQSMLGETVPAGSFNAGRRLFEATAQTDFAQSPLVGLLRQVAPAEDGRQPHLHFFTVLAKGWVAGVLAVAALGFAIWLPHGVDRAINVAVGLLVVTCPCAIGIAVPLAYQLTHARLRKAGFYARRDDLLDRLPRIRRLIFDKTGTLTLGSLELVDAAALPSLSSEVRDVAYNLAARSSHPQSVCLARALEKAGAVFDASLSCEEHAGKGLEATVRGRRYRLGKWAWAVSETPPADARGPVLTCDGRLLAAFAMREVMRAEAPAVLGRLQAQGFDIHLLSGDRSEAVSEVAARLSVAPTHAQGALSPEAKAAQVRALDRADTLYLGDGVNDALAFQAAFCAGTPAVDRPVMPGKADFFLLGAGLWGLEAAIEQSSALRRAVRRLVAASVSYNTLVIMLGLAGLLSPLRAAVAMPLSSITLVLMTLSSIDRQPQALRRSSMQLAEVTP
ncbi:MAG: heavy metal translocating P-type ATPase metal-binding domain-containing protein [Myxococcaceae bacterium]|nr:heavy metal translocating P-type ATPase metal-binding domain-containing protein [Myxococcaceae bacterium]